ncbi:MAG: Holliday junction branch migration protein RuvA [Candidatus Doudnabacteria bacterium CG10_big_fil_rev_8_21_14_0_10_41_10]|uniref:Holliday junction branch migration complex subunit RuvA n=1 Tax=Candidatus Doudnabacteria bacterium CG10_big_fil_rev_8_21_14_0_10_41_10 TaxID=1974551 RepID=A0A2H0VG31_9BACT|nr:MAG: Holliday junction branch migration protein RuvA [Candidatus Doudnabacteria bacterium CG10_big_fil_rev_8_21_14_0_10_41_10]
MISYLKGSVLSKQANYATVETQGVGYKVFIPVSSLLELRLEQEIELYIRTYVREDQFSLYGFLSPKELELFELLISVSGVGPKVALAVLSGGTVEVITSAIGSGDPSIFTKVSGVGKKTAERIVVELKEKIGTGDLKSSKDLSESLDALVALGYSKLEAREVLKRISSKDLDSGSIIKEALRVLGKR